MGQILGLLSLIFARCISWFNQILHAVDGAPVWFSAVMVYLCFKFLLRPVFGSVGSDRATSRKKKGDQ